MAKSQKLYLIDFQDARMGCPHYDVASLIYDAYVPISDSEKLALLDVYQKELENYPVAEQVDWDVFLEQVQLIGLQRTLKAAGSFASFYNRFEKSTHLDYLLPVLECALELTSAQKTMGERINTIFPISLWMKLVKAKKEQGWSK